MASIIQDDSNAIQEDQAQATSQMLEGEKQAEFDRLMRKSYRRAYNLAYRMTGDPLEAEDLTQETFLRAYRFFDKYNRWLAFEAWLRQIMHNLYVDMLRRKPKTQGYSLDQPLPNSSDDDDDMVADFPDSGANPEKQLLAVEFSADMQEALNRLPHEFREAVVLCDIEDMSYDEIASAVGVSTGTVRSRIHRGRRLLRKWLSAGNSDEEPKIMA
ncbi:MAG: sigma-70 family RNA polymerase sigma factor [bacterium]